MSAVVQYVASKISLFWAYLIGKRNTEHIVIEGNIATGKTTLGLGFSRRGITFREETLDLKFLEAIREEPGLVFGFQYKKLISGFQHEQFALLGADNIILDRSHGGAMVFSIVAHANRNMSDLAFGLIDTDWKTTLATHDSGHQIVTVLLCSDPERNLESLKNRGRDVEMALTLDYLIKVHVAYLAVLIWLAAFMPEFRWVAIPYTTFGHSDTHPTGPDNILRQITLTDQVRPQVSISLPQWVNKNTRLSVIYRVLMCKDMHTIEAIYEKFYATSLHKNPRIVIFDE